MSYAATGAVAVMWKAEPMPVPCCAASVVSAGVTLAGQSSVAKPSLAPGLALRKRMATSPAGMVPLAMGAYWMLGPEPVGMYANFDGSRAVPAKSTVSVTAVSHVFATYAARQPPAPPPGPVCTSGSTA